MKDVKILWPVLIISGQFNAQDDEGFRLRELVDALKEHHDLNVIPSFTYEDGYEIYRSRSDFGAIIVDWDIPTEDKTEITTAERLITSMRKRHKGVPILLLASRLTAGEIPLDILENINGFLWKTADTIHLSLIHI